MFSAAGDRAFARAAGISIIVVSIAFAIAGIIVTLVIVIELDFSSKPDSIVKSRSGPNGGLSRALIGALLRKFQISPIASCNTQQTASQKCVK